MLTFPFGERYRSPCVLVLGGFDGLHLGHRKLIAEAKTAGLPVVLTSMYGGKGKQLFVKRERDFLFARADVDVCEITLSEEMCALPAEAFLEELFSTVPARRVVCGADFRFGKGAEGTASLLKRLAPCPVEAAEPVGSPLEGGKTRKFSTSACKAMLSKGDLARLNACLIDRSAFYDGAYFIGGEVEHGREVGRTYGFPTLNLSVPEHKLLPPDGVYGGMCATPKGDFPTILNIGARPTFGVAERKIEAYLDGFSGDLYGADVRVYPLKFYRKIETFASAKELKTQLAADVERLKNDKTLLK